MNDSICAVDVASALGDATRARICALLATRDLCVCELTGALHLSQATISGHLRILGSAHLVTSCQRSYWTHYALRHDLPPVLAAFVAAVIADVQRRYPADAEALATLPPDVCSSSRLRRSSRL